VEDTVRRVIPSTVIVFSISLSNTDVVGRSDIGEEGAVLVDDEDDGVELPEDDVCHDPSENG
jgi:hypothetical protein